MNCCKLSFICIKSGILQTRDTYLLQTTLLPPVKQEITDNLILQRDTNNCSLSTAAVGLFRNYCTQSFISYMYRAWHPPDSWHTFM